MVLVSVVMNAYNHEKYISEAIESILNQSFKDLELIIIDDSSHDTTPLIIRKYQTQDSRIRAIFHEKNMGIAETMNECISEAKGKFISFISSDDVWLTAKLEKQLEILKENENALVWSEGEVIDGSGYPRGFSFTQMHRASKKRKSGNILLELIDDNFIFGQSLITKTEYAKCVKYNSQLKYLNDYQFMVDLASQHDFLFIPEPLAKYRIHGKNSILRDKSDWLADRIMLRTYFLQKYGNVMSNNLKANLYLKIGEAFSSLGKDDVAKQFFLKAIRSGFLSKEVILYLAYALTNAKGVIGRFLLVLYLKIDSIVRK